MSRTPAVDGFSLICEVEPATQPDLDHVRHQVGVMSSIASAFLVPDNHLGRPTVSSIAVAHEVARMGQPVIACLNARDRNALGFRRDLLTAAAYGIDELLFVYGDRPEAGRRSDELTVRSMIEEARRFGSERTFTAEPFRIGVSVGLTRAPAWKLQADFLFVQVSFDLDRLLRWRSTIEFDGPIFAGVMAPSSAEMARTLSAKIPELAVPNGLISALENDRDAGVHFACEMIDEIRRSKAFDGAHVIPVTRFREVTERLLRC